jgi:hypothetical protein
MMRRILIGALFIAVVFIVGRTILGTPGMRRMVEGFQSSAPPSTLNTVTECPTGTQMFMYNGAAYCCNGILNPDADDLQQTCKAPLARNFDLIFCTLGPPSAVPNCMELRAGQMQAKGEELCPRALPNYAQGGYGSTTVNGRCCQTMANASFTDCNDITGPNSFCDLTANPDIFKEPNSCQFQRLKDDAAAQCPSGYASFLMNGQGPYIGSTLIGCSNSSQTCYPQIVLDKMREIGYEISSLTPCPVPVQEDAE